MQLTSKHIFDFIEALPGANVRQYAKLLNIEPSRLNKFLGEDRLGKRLVRANVVRGPMKGRMPNWATRRTERGVLMADDVVLTDNPTLQRILLTLPSAYRPDAEHMFRMLIQMSSGNITFEDGFAELTGPYVHLAGEHAAQQGELRAIKDLNGELREAVALLREAKDLTHTQLLRLTAPERETVAG